MVQDLSYSPNSETVLQMADLLFSLGCSCNKAEHDQQIYELDNNILQAALVAVPDSLSRNPVLTCMLQYVRSASLSLDVRACKAIVDALIDYQKYLVTWLSIQKLTSELAAIVDKSVTSEMFKAEFRSISQNIPQLFLDAFANKTQLCINCWTTMSIELRSKLKLALLKTSLLDNLSNTSLLQVDIECHTEHGEESLTRLPAVKDIRNLLSEITRLVSGNSGKNSLGSSFDVPLCDFDLCIDSNDISRSSETGISRSDIVAACLRAWILESPPSQSAGALNPKNLENTFQEGTMSESEILNYRRACMESAKREKYCGPIDKITSPHQNGADDCIKSVMDHIKMHKSESPASRMATIVACKTSVSPAVSFGELSTLWSETWISSKIIEFGLHQHALRIGACCFKFQNPLPEGPKIYFANTWFFHLYVIDHQKWCLGTDWDWLIAPTFVDSNHFIMIAVSFTQKKILCCDSSKGISRMECLKLTQQWIVSLKIDASEAEGWLLQECMCPQQENGYDCGIFAFMASAYLPLCDGDVNKMSECYSQNHATAVRKLLADSIYQHGESMRINKWGVYAHI